MMPSRGFGLSMTIWFSRLARAIGQGGVELVVQQARLLHQAVVRPADVEAARRQA
jgi:hypothetical protein